MNKNNTYYVVQLKNCGGAAQAPAQAAPEKETEEDIED